jgi:hypothetical protein
MILEGSEWVLCAKALPWEGKMTAKVQSEYFAQYNMPHCCVACGSADTSGKIYAGQSNWNGKQSVSLAFPLCADCGELLKVISKRAKWLGVLAVLGAIFGCMLGQFLSIDSSGHPDSLVTVVSGILAFILIAGGLRHPFTTRGMSEDQVERVNHINHAVKILEFRLPGAFFGKGRVTFQFESNTFATEFATLNNGKLK